jgi:ABC-type Fe3+ transport system permease subunit
MKIKEYLDMEFLKDFLKSLIALLFALATLLIGTGIQDVMNESGPLINTTLATENVTKFLEIENQNALKTSWNTIYLAIILLLVALTIVLLVARYSKTKLVYGSVPRR